MRRKPTAQVSIDLLESLFQEFDIWGKIRDQRLSGFPLPEKDVPSHHYSNARSRIVKHGIPNGRHVATTHRIETMDGSILHEDAKDFHLQKVRLWRT